jgi:hypothetical protein
VRIVKLLHAFALRPALEVSAQVWCELLQLIPSDVIGLIDSPAQEQSFYIAVLLRVIGEGYSRLSELSENLRGIEDWRATILARD